NIGWGRCARRHSSSRASVTRLRAAAGRDAWPNCLGTVASSRWLALTERCTPTPSASRASSLSTRDDLAATRLVVGARLPLRRLVAVAARRDALTRRGVRAG